MEGTTPTSAMNHPEHKSQAPADTGVGLLLSDDLLFRSRITGTAEVLGLIVHAARSADDLLRQAGQLRPACVLLDLHNPGLDVAAVVRQLKGQQAAPYVVAYGSHVEAATLRRAREAGCDRVLPRSQFVEELPTALLDWLGRREG
jgi:CheY-like chemotaxis protein